MPCRSRPLFPTSSRRFKMDKKAEIPEDRPLTNGESGLIRWLLQNGVPEASAYLPQLDLARVVSRCYCGCASINFAINGVVPPVGNTVILADYEWQATAGEMFGVFVFERGGLLAGLEVWSQDGRGEATMLPDIKELRPIGTCSTAWPGRFSSD